MEEQNLGQFQANRTCDPPNLDKYQHIGTGIYNPALFPVGGPVKSTDIPEITYIPPIINQTAKEKMELVEQALDEYEKGIGLPSCQQPGSEDELNGYLTMDRNTVEKLTPDAAGSLAFRLSQYCVYIRRLYNREKSKIIWANKQLSRMIAIHNNDYDKFTKHEVKIALIIKDDSYAQSVNSILVYAEQRAQRLEEISSTIKDLAATIKSIGYTKSQMIRNP
jgi:hypothetical protein